MRSNRLPVPAALPSSPLPALPRTPNAFEEARAFDLDADALFDLVAETIPQVRSWRFGKPQSIETRAHPRRLEAPYRVALFVDDVRVAVEPISKGRAVLFVQSRSRVGASDLGTNRRRVSAILEAISEAVQA